MAASREPALYTIGHSTLAIEDFIAILEAHGIRRLIDIRTVPRSRHNPQFNRDELPKTLKKAGIEYHFAYAPHAIRYPGSHRRRNSKRFVDAAHTLSRARAAPLQ